MAGKCPICSEGELAEINVRGVGLRICARCHSAVFPEGKILEMARKLLQGTVDRWADALEREAPLAVPSAPKCPEHGEPMARGVVKGFGHECWKSSCCDTIALSPADAVPVLRLLRASAIGEAEHKAPDVFNPLMFVSKLLFKAEKKDKEMSDAELGLDDAQFTLKFAKALGLKEGE